ncbi:MAG: hypothetical protein QM769_06920 [Pseudoxanthomonas sp.]
MTLFLFLPGFISAPINFLLAVRWIRALYREDWRRQLQEALRGPGDDTHLPRFQLSTSYALMRIRQRVLLALCRVVLALVPARVVADLLRDSAFSADAILAIWRVAQMGEALLVLAMMFVLVRSVQRERIRAGRRTAGRRL